MRLFDAKSVREQKKASNDSELYTAYKSKKILEKEVVKLQEFKDSIEPRKRKEIEAFSAYMKKMQGKKGLILKEIKDLEKQRDKVMLPLDNRKMELMEFEDELNKRKDKLIFGKQEFSKKNLEMKGEKKIIREKIEKLIRVEKELLEKQKESKNRQKKLKDNEAGYAFKISKLNEDRQEVEAHKQDIENREDALKLKFEAFKNKEDRIYKQRKIIESKQAQLKAAYQEIKKKE